MNNTAIILDHVYLKSNIHSYNSTSQGSKLTKNSSRNLATFSRRISALHFPVSGLAKQNMSPQFLSDKETAENGE